MIKPNERWGNLDDNNNRHLPCNKIIISNCNNRPAVAGPSGHSPASADAWGHAVAAQGKSKLALIVGFDADASGAEPVNLEGDELGGALDHLASGESVSITDPAHGVGVAGLEGLSGHRVLCG